MQFAGIISFPSTVVPSLVLVRCWASSILAGFRGFEDNNIIENDGNKALSIMNASAIIRVDCMLYQVRMVPSVPGQC